MIEEWNQQIILLSNILIQQIYFSQDNAAYSANNFNRENTANKLYQKLRMYSNIQLII